MLKTAIYKLAVARFYPPTEAFKPVAVRMLSLFENSRITVVHSPAIEITRIK